MEYKKVKLSEHRGANCCVHIFDNGDINFISYTTLVISAKYNKENKCHLLSCTGVYSRTTIRQIVWFLREYFPEISYYHMRDISGTDGFIWAKCNKH